jgi:hypothetical protein
MQELETVETLARQVAEAMRGPEVPCSAFAAPAYTCDCTPHPSGNGEVSPPAVSTPAAIAAAVQASKLPGGPAELLLRFFLQQVLSHHGYTWTHSTPGKDAHFYFSAVLSVLDALELNPDLGEMAAVAQLFGPTTAIGKRLGGQAGETWLKDLREVDRMNGTELKHPLPSAFCPGKMADPAQQLALVRSLQGQLGLPPHSPEAADRLAREVASIMTDPWFAARLQWAAQGPLDTPFSEGAERKMQLGAFKKIADRYAERLKPDRRPSVYESLSPGTRAAPVVERIRAIQKYLAFTHEHWNALQNRLHEETATP